MDNVDPSLPPPDPIADKPSTTSEEDYDRTFQADRRANDQRLKSRFEQIFAKYERDFTGIGDEIDLETGEIVVNNGHLDNLQHETDPGQAESLRFVCAFANGLEVEESEISESEDEEYEDESGRGGGGWITENEISAQQHPRTPIRSAELSTDKADRNTEDFALDPRLRSKQYAGAPPTPSESASGDEEEASAIDTVLAGIDTEAGRAGPDTDVLVRASPNHIHVLQSILEDLKTSTVDQNNQNALQAIGERVAAQLADLVARGQDCHMSYAQGSSTSDPVWAYPDLPSDRVRQPEASRRLRPRLSALASPCLKDGDKKASLWAPMLVPPLSRKRRRDSITAATTEQPTLDSAFSYKAPPTLPDPALGSLSSTTNVDNDFPSDSSKQCAQCGIKVTVVWRRGPNGDVCNACGMYFYRYGQFRPISEEFASSETDNSPKGARAPRYVAFSKEDDALIIKLKEIDQSPWDVIARHFPQRSWWSIQGRYSRRLHAVACRGRQTLIEQGYPCSVDRFTAAEDELIIIHARNSVPWCDMANQMAFHTAASIEARHGILIGGVQASDPVKRKRPIGKHYSAEEDEMLIKLREVDGLSWERLAFMYPHRTVMALQKRYTRALQKRGQAPGHESPNLDALAQFNTEQGTADIIHVAATDMITENFTDGQAHDLDTNLESARPMDHPFTETETKSDEFNYREDEQLLDLRDNHKLDWDMIQLWMTGKSADAIQNRYRTLHQQMEFILHPETENDASILPSEDVFTPFKDVRPIGRGRFTTLEDQTLVRLKARDCPWDEIESNFPTIRSLSSIINRWKKLTNHLSPLLANTIAAAASDLPHDDFTSQASLSAQHQAKSPRLLSRIAPLQQLQTPGRSSLNLFNSLINSTISLRADDAKIVQNDDIGLDLLNLPSLPGTSTFNDAFLDPTLRSQPNDTARQDVVPSPLASAVVAEAEEVEGEGLVSNSLDLVFGHEQNLDICTTGDHDVAAPLSMNAASYFPVDREYLPQQSQCNTTAAAILTLPVDIQIDDAPLEPELIADAAEDSLCNSDIDTSFANDVHARTRTSENDVEENPTISLPQPESVSRAVDVSCANNVPAVENITHVERSSSNSCNDGMVELPPTNAAATRRRRSNDRRKELRTPRTGRNSSAAPRSTASKQFSRRRKRFSRRRSEARETAIPDTDASECSWNSDRNNDDSSDSEGITSSKRGTRHNSDLSREASPMHSPSPVKPQPKNAIQSRPKDVESSSYIRAHQTPMAITVSTFSVLSSKAEKSVCTPQHESSSSVKQGLSLNCSLTRFVAGSVKKRVVETPQKPTNGDTSEDELA